MSRLTAAQREALLAGRDVGADPVALARQLGISSDTLNRFLRQFPLDVVDVEAHMLPVVPVRLVGRPSLASVCWLCLTCGLTVPDDFIHCPACGAWRQGYAPKGVSDAR